MHPSHRPRTRVSSGSSSYALDEAGYGAQETGTNEPTLRRHGRSLCVQATKRPLVTAALLGAAGLAFRAVRARAAA